MRVFTIVLGITVTVYAVVAMAWLWSNKPKPRKPLYRVRDRHHS